MATVEPEGEVVSLLGQSLEDTNSIEEPNNVVPRKEKLGGLNASLTRDFPAYSLTVIKVAAK